MKRTIFFACLFFSMIPLITAPPRSPRCSESRGQEEQEQPGMKEFKNATDFKTFLLKPAEELQDITIVKCADCNIQEISPLIKKLSNLQFLDLAGNKLKRIPPEIGSLSNLDCLILDKNELSELPPAITELPKLTKLYFCNNKFTTAPPQVWELVGLTELRLDDNKLTSISPQIKQLKNLTQLYLNNNLLTDLPNEVEQLEKLWFLQLNTNRFTRLPAAITRIKKLSALSANYNSIATVPAELSRLDNLVFTLGNPISYIPPELHRRAKKNFYCPTAALLHTPPIPTPDQDGHLRLNHPEEARWLIEALIEHPELYNDIETIELNEFCQETIEQHLEGYLREKPAATEEALYFASHQSWLLDFCLFSPS